MRQYTETEKGSEMAYEQKDNSGSLFKNDRKEKDTHPDMQGSALIDGVDYWVSGWTNRPEGKKAYISLSFKPKEEAPDERAGEMKEEDDLIGF